METIEIGSKAAKPETPEVEKETYVPLKDVNTADAASTPPSGVMEAAVAERPALVEPLARKVDITAADKSAFIDAIVSGNRFTTYSSLFDGKVVVKFRSRSLEETEAIIAYMRHNGISGEFQTQVSVQNASLVALLVAQVQELNGVEYSEMKAPLMYTETLDGVKEPAWVADVEMWRKKPEALVSALGDALVEFESKYWTMTRAAADENFWKPDGSTGK